MKNVLKYPGSKTRIAKWIAEFITAEKNMILVLKLLQMK